MFVLTKENISKIKQENKKQSTGKPEGTDKEELQIFKDFHEDRMKNTIFIGGLKRRGKWNE